MQSLPYRFPLRRASTVQRSAGTGMQRYRALRVEPKEDARAAAYPAATYATPDVSYPFGSPAGDSVPLEEYDFGAYHR